MYRRENTNPDSNVARKFRIDSQEIFCLLNEIRKDIVNDTSRSEWRREEIEVPCVCLFALTYCLYSIFLASSVASVISEPSFQYLYIAHCNQTTPANLVGPATIRFR